MSWRDAPLYVRCHDLARWVTERAMGWQRPGADLVGRPLCDATQDLLCAVGLALTFPRRRTRHLQDADEAVVRLRLRLRRRINSECRAPDKLCPGQAVPRTSRAPDKLCLSGDEDLLRDPEPTTSSGSKPGCQPCAGMYVPLVASFPQKTVRHYNLPGHGHELTFSCHDNRPYLLDEQVCRWLIGSINQARRSEDYALVAYVIMPEHVHLLVVPRRFPYDVAQFLRSVKQPPSRRLSNWLKKHDPQLRDAMCVPSRTRGPVFRLWLHGPGYDRNVVDERAAHWMVRYIHNNPVRRGLVAHPEDWTWSSARFYVTGEPVPLAVDSWP